MSTSPGAGLHNSCKQFMGSLSSITSVTQWHIAQTHTHASSYTMHTHVKLSMLGYKDWGLYPCSWCRHLSPPLILFHLERMRVGERKKYINFMSALRSGFCLTYTHTYTHWLVLPGQPVCFSLSLSVLVHLFSSSGLLPVSFYFHSLSFFLSFGFCL